MFLKNRFWYTCIYTYLIIISLSLISSCEEEQPVPDEKEYLTQPVCDGEYTIKDYDHHVVGFYPYYRQDELMIKDIPWEKLTRVIYAFAVPESDGSLNTSDLSQTDLFVGLAHAHGVEAFFSIGGAADSDAFPKMAVNGISRSKFVKEVREYLFAHCFDGVDIDWEKWTGNSTGTIIHEESDGLVRLVKELKTELEPFGLKVSIDLYGSNSGGKHYYDELTEYADQLMVMSYCFSGPWSDPGPHSAYEDAIGSGSDVNSTGLAYWANYRGWPKEKLLLGVPFFGIDFDLDGGTWLTYKNIIQNHPEAFYADQVNNIYYDGLETMRRKTQYIIDNQFDGIMIWEIAQDTQPDSTSLLQAIHETIHP